MRRLTGLLAVSLLAAFPAWADAAYPDKPIRFVVGFSAGGGTDTVARILGQKMSEIFGQQIVVENRPGAGGRIASQVVAKSRPDGATILFVSAGFAIDAALYKTLSFDPIGDFAPISMAASAPYVVVVHPSVQAHTVAELIALAKRAPGTLNDASAGPGSTLDLAFQLFRSKAGVNIVEVSYQGANGIPDLISGRVQLSFAGLPQTAAFIKSGQLRALAVSTPQRSALAPDLPTVAESGLPGYAVTSWYGALAPAGTPPAIVAKLSDGIKQALADPQVRARLVANGIEPRGTSPDEFAGTIKSEIDQWKKVVKDAGIPTE
jgi:tripartite-type tricarboxylate transporter receptor subunit TctC